MSEFTQALTDAGFTSRPVKPELVKDDARQTGGPFQILGIFTKGEVRVTIEQNTAEVPGGQMTYPPVAVITGPGGSVSCDPENDVELLLSLVAELA